MILQQDKLAESSSVGVESSTQMTVDQSDQRVLAMILGKNLYSDGIGSTIREWTSNALDATREAGSTEPVVVSLKKDNYQDWFKVTDKGTGISPDRAINVISKYAASTKRNSADQLGFFGLGMKAGLAYTDSFNIETVYEGTKYIYNMYEAEEGTKLDLIISMPTIEQNGSTFAIKLKNYSDRNEFLAKIKEQLSYFEGVYFEVPEINNDFRIITTTDWKYSELSKDTYMHLCLDNVYYPIDWAKLGINRIDLPIALNFAISEGIIPIPNRESIKYTNSVKELILNKIASVADYFVTEYNKTCTEANSIFDVWNEIGNKTHYVTVPEMGRRVSINSIEKYSSVKTTPVTVKGIKHLQLDYIVSRLNYILGYYYSRGYIAYGKYTSTGDKPYLDRYVLKTQHYDILIADEQPTKLMMDYLKHLYKDKTLYLLRRDISKTLSRYKGLLYLTKSDRANWRDKIKEIQIVEDEIHARFVNMDTITPTQEWLDERKANRAVANKTSVSREEINPKKLVIANRGDYATRLEAGSKVVIGDLGKAPETLLYFNSSDIEPTQRKLIDKYWAIVYYSSKPCRIVGLCTRDYYKLKAEKIHNVHEIFKFMKEASNGKLFGDFCTKYVVSQFFNKHADTLRYKDHFAKFSKEISDKITNLSVYTSSSYRNMIDQKVMEEMMDICTEKKLWNLSMLALKDELEKVIPAFNFFSVFSLNTYSPLKPEVIELSKEILKGRKIKLNLDCYKTVANVDELAKVDPEELSPDDEDEEAEKMVTDDILENEVI